MRVNVSSCSERTVKMDTCAHTQLLGERPPRGFLGTIADDVEVHFVTPRDCGDDAIEALVRDETPDEHQSEVTV